MRRIGLAAAALLLAGSWAAAQVPAVLVGLPHPVSGLVPPTAATALDRCVRLIDAPPGSFTAGPSLVRDGTVVVIARSATVSLACTIKGENMGAGHRDIDQGEVVSASGLMGGPPSNLHVAYGAVRADVARLNILTASGRVIAAQVGGGSFLAELTDVPEADALRRVHQAFDSRGVLLYQQH